MRRHTEWRIMAHRLWVWTQWKNSARSPKPTPAAPPPQLSIKVAHIGPPRCLTAAAHLSCGGGAVGWALVSDTVLKLKVDEPFFPTLYTLLNCWIQLMRCVQVTQVNSETKVLMLIIGSLGDIVSSISILNKLICHHYKNYYFQPFENIYEMRIGHFWFEWTWE